MIIFEDLGVGLTEQKIVPGATATGFNTDCIVYKRFVLNYDSGGTTEIVVGDWLKCETSGALAKVVSVTLSTGTWAGGNAAGYFIVDSKVGTFTNDKILYVNNADCGTVNEATYGDATPVKGDYPYKGMEAKAALVTAYTQTALVSYSGGKPDQDALMGIPMASGTSLLLKNSSSIKNFKCIDYANGSATTIRAVFSF